MIRKITDEITIMENNKVVAIDERCILTVLKARESTI